MNFAGLWSLDAGIWHLASGHWFLDSDFYQVSDGRL